MSAAPRTVSLPAPPTSARLRDFYLDYLPKLWAAIFGKKPLPAVPVAVTFTIVPKSGATEHFTVMAHDRLFATREGTAEDPLVTCTTTPQAWRLTVRDLLPRALRLLGPSVARVRARLDELAHAPAPLANLVRTLQKSPGSIAIEFTDDAGDVSACELTIGSGDGPRASLAINDADLWPFLSGEIKFAKLLRSRVRLDGDVAYLLRLARLFDPTVAR